MGGPGSGRYPKGSHKFIGKGSKKRVRKSFNRARTKYMEKLHRTNPKKFHKYMNSFAK